MQSSMSKEKQSLREPGLISISEASRMLGSIAQGKLSLNGAYVGIECCQVITHYHPTILFNSVIS